MLLAFTLRWWRRPSQTPAARATRAAAPTPVPMPALVGVLRTPAAADFEGSGLAVAVAAGGGEVLEGGSVVVEEMDEEVVEVVVSLDSITNARLDSWPLTKPPPSVVSPEGSLIRSTKFWFSVMASSSMLSFSPMVHSKVPVFSSLAGV